MQTALRQRHTYKKIKSEQLIPLVSIKNDLFCYFQTPELRYLGTQFPTLFDVVHELCRQSLRQRHTYKKIKSKRRISLVLIMKDMFCYFQTPELRYLGMQFPTLFDVVYELCRQSLRQRHTYKKIKSKRRISLVSMMNDMFCYF